MAFHPGPYARTSLFLMGVGALGVLVSPVLGYRAIGYIFLLGVLAVGAASSLGPVLYAAFVSALAWNFLFIPPRFTFAIAHAEDALLCLTFFVAALITGVLTHRIRRHQIVLQEREISEKLHQTLLNSISHELRTPLTAIMGCASALGDERGPDTRVYRQSLAAELATASDRLNRVIENLLDMSRISSGAIHLKKEWHDVHDLIGVTLQRLGQNLRRHLVEVDVAPDLPLIEIDFHLFEHVLSNLLMNAAQYSPAGSRIWIRASAQENVQIAIEDEGRGLSQDQLEKVFEKFYRVPGTPAGGTGLGLSIARSLVELHAGQIHAEALSGPGARFVIRLPRGNPPALPRDKDEKNIAY